MWWKQFNDEALNILIEEALAHSNDVKLSALKILKARQTYGLSDAAAYPTLNATAGSTRQQTSNEAYATKDKRAIYQDSNLKPNLGYEIDLWGKLSNQSQTNWSAYLSSKAAAQTVKNSLIHEVTLAYFNIASLDARMRILEQSAIVYRQNYEFRTKQYQSGSINELLANQTKHNTTMYFLKKRACLKVKKFKKARWLF